jgi:hypothetical protein
MEELNFFKFEDRDDFYAATLGISSLDWTSTTTKEFSKNKAGVVETMSQNRFDILPAQRKSRNFDFCISTATWGDFNAAGIGQRKIDIKEDVIYYLTHVRDVLRLMHEKNRNFYFLSNHSDIIGLVTIANFNDKQFYFWLYKKLVILEKGLSGFIKNLNSNQEILETIKQFSVEENDPNGYFSQVLNRFTEDEKKGSDAEIFEYLYFHQLCKLIIHFRLYSKLGLTKADFESGLGYLNKIRTLVAHPSRSVINNPGDLALLWKGIKKMDDLTIALKRFHEV